MAIPDCNRELRKNGAAMVSRTCARCGLGPCSQALADDPLSASGKRLAAVGVESITPEMKRADVSNIFEGVPVVPEPDVPGDEAYPWANGDGQILLRSFIFEQLSTPQSTLDFKKEIPSMEAFRTWIMTGTFPGASKLSVVQP